MDGEATCPFPVGLVHAAMCMRDLHAPLAPVQKTRLGVRTQVRTRCNCHSGGGQGSGCTRAPSLPIWLWPDRQVVLRSQLGFPSQVQLCCEGGTLPRPLAAMVVAELLAVGAPPVHPPCVHPPEPGVPSGKSAVLLQRCSMLAAQ